MFKLNVYAQTWIDNNITRYFENSYVWDFGFTNDALWVLSVSNDSVIPMLTKYKDNSFTNYYIGVVSEGPLDDYKKAPTGKRNFYPSFLLVQNDKVWLCDRSKLIYCLVHNDSVKFLKSNYNDSEKIINSNQFIDGDGNLYTIAYYQDIINESEYKMFFSTGLDEFTEYQFPINFDSGLTPRFLLFNDNSIFFVAEDAGTNTIIYSSENNTNDNKFLKLDNIYINNYYNNNSNIYLWCTDITKSRPNSNILVLDYKLNLISKYSLRKNLGLSTCSFFVSNNKSAFISDGSGFYEYDYLSNKLTFIEEKINKLYFGIAFRRIKIHKNIIYGCYDGLNDLFDCRLLNDFGLYLYDIGK